MRLGSLCCIDHQEKKITKSQIKALQILARQVVAHFEERLHEIERLQLVKFVEEQKVRAAASAKMASLGQMASGIAHEINNPLTAIMIWSAEI